MITKSRPIHVSVHLASVLLLAACTGISVDRAGGGRFAEPTREALEKQRENELQRAWRGRPYGALLHAFGVPKLIMNVPGYRPLRTSVVVYGILDTRSECIDAFTVVVHGNDDQETVADYFCR